MHRIDGADHVGNMFSETPPATVITDDWLNALQEEIREVIVTLAGTPLSKPDNTQLRTALVAVFARLASANTLTGLNTFTKSGAGGAIEATGGSSHGTAIKGTGGATDGKGVHGIAAGTGNGVYGVAAGGGSAVKGEATGTGGSGVEGLGNTTGHGVKGTAGGSASSAGVLGTAAGSGTIGVQGDGGAGFGVNATATTGVPIVATGDTTNPPARGTIYLVPQLADPTTGAVGEMYVTSAGKLVICTNAAGPVWTIVGTQS